MRQRRIDPDIVVGIDFGMTCTGVAYSVAPEWSTPTTIRQWPGNIFLVCDAGGGTTDISALRVKDDRSFRTELEPLLSVQGEAVGSTLIDFHVEAVIAERLKCVAKMLEEPPEKVAGRMISTDRRFETFKCSFGFDEQDERDLLLPVPGLCPGIDYPAAHIRNSMMIISRNEFRAEFDEMINQVFSLIDGEIQKLQMSNPGDDISYLVVSGGFGSSPYLKQRLRRRYELNGREDFYNARSVKVLSAKDPQLAVCHGLVINRTQELESRVSVYTERCCRNSYGIVVRQLYDPALHQGEDISYDSRDRQRWAENQIHWLIKKDERVSVKDGVAHPYSLKFDRGVEDFPWSTHIVMSSLPADQLPRILKHRGVKPLCVLESCIDHRALTIENPHWYNIGKRYYRADFDMKVIVGPADVRFEIWTKDGRISKAHEEIEVNWDPLMMEQME